MTKQPNPHYAHILDTLETIRTYTPTTKEAFMSDPNAQDATLMRLQDIGEQLVHIRDQFPDSWERHHDNSWHQVIGMRNIISHGYREIDFDVVWDTVAYRLSDFTKTIERVK